MRKARGKKGYIVTTKKEMQQNVLLTAQGDTHTYCGHRVARAVVLDVTANTPT